MAFLKDLIVTGASQFLDGITVSKINVPISSGSTSYGAGTSGQVLLSNGSNVYWGSAAPTVTESTVSGWGFTKNGGTVTSVGATGTNGITISGSPITSSGSITIGLNLSTAINTLSEGSSPANRNDYAVVQYAGGGTSTTTYHRRKLSNVFAALNSSDITTALGNQNANVVLAGPSSGSAAAPAFRKLVAADIDGLDISVLNNDIGYITSADVPEGASAYTGTIKAVGTTASNGSNNGFARGDHVHNITKATIDNRLGTGSGTTKFYREDGTWATPAYTTNTDEKLKIAAVSSGTVYYPIVATNSTIAANRQYDATGFAYVGTNGTTSAVGAAKITLGNATASGTANNKQGSIVLYGSTTYATTITPGALTATRTITLPDATGTVALTSNPTIATDSGTATVTLAHNTTYKLTAGGGSLIFKTPADGNSDTKVTQTSTDTSANYEVLFSETADDTTRTEAARKSSKLLFNPSSGILRVKANDNPTLVIQNSDTDILATSLTTEEKSSIYFWDKDAYTIGYIQSYQLTDGTARITIGACRQPGTDASADRLYNRLTLDMGKDGTRTVSMSDASVWRNAIGAVNKAGDTMTGNLKVTKAGDAYIEVQNSSTQCRITLESGNATKHGLYSSGYYNGSSYTNSGSWILYRGSDGYVHSDTRIYGAVWNDYAEMRNVPEAQEEKSRLKPGMCVHENGDGTMIMSVTRLERGCKVISDTFGFNIGETEECKTPITVSGRVLVYINEGREMASSHIGWPVCSGPNGTVSIMTEEEEKKYPSRIIGTISEIPNYEEWGAEKVKVNGRIWIYVK